MFQIGFTMFWYIYIWHLVNAENTIVLIFYYINKAA